MENKHVRSTETWKRRHIELTSVLFKLGLSGDAQLRLHERFHTQFACDFFFPWWVSPTVSSHEVKTFKFGIMLARAVFPYWLVDGQNPSSQAPTHGLMGYKLWSWNSASVREPEWSEPTTWIRSVSLSGSLYIPHLSVFCHCSYRLCIYIITYLYKTECASYFSLYQHIYSVFAITDTVY